MTQSAPPGWYPDSANPATLRWWDGSAWTEHVQPAAPALAPVPHGRAAIVCPHCHTQGQVRAMRVRAKRGISGAKVTGAVFTFGFSLLATGLSRKERATRMRCGNCKTTWLV